MNYELIDLIKEIQGNRLTEDYAAELGIARTTLYNILSGNRAKTLPDDLIQKIYDSKNEFCNITLEQLREANNTYGHRFANNVLETEKKFRKAIINYVAELGNTLTINKNTSKWIDNKSRIIFDLRMDISNNNQKYSWFFDFKPGRLNIYRILERITYDFQKQQLDDSEKISFVVDSVESYNAIINQFTQQYNTCFSVIRIDPDSYEVMEEKVINR